MAPVKAKKDILNWLNFLIEGDILGFTIKTITIAKMPLANALYVVMIFRWNTLKFEEETDGFYTVVYYLFKALFKGQLNIRRNIHKMFVIFLLKINSWDLLRWVRNKIHLPLVRQFTNRFKIFIHIGSKY